MIIITGASKGIGNYLFKEYIKKEKISGTYLTTIPENHENLDYLFKVDISNFNSVIEFYKRIETELNNITLINCAGISYNSFAHKSSPEEWKKVIDVNLIGTYNMIRAFLPCMREQKYGRIINISSVVAQKATPGVSAYAASKSGLWGLAKSVAIENARLNITINNINLGYSEIGLINEVPENYKQFILSQIPNSGFCKPEDILQTINYLRDTSYVTGASIDLNGGLF